VQAFRGQPLIAPDLATMAQLGVWIVATAVAAGLAVRSDTTIARHAAVV